MSCVRCNVSKWQRNMQVKYEIPVTAQIKITIVQSLFIEILRKKKMETKSNNLGNIKVMIYT